MPISTPVPIVKPTKQEFYEVDHLVTGHAFATALPLSVANAIETMQLLLRRLLEHTRLHAIAWINIAGETIQFRTLKRQTPLP